MIRLTRRAVLSAASVLAIASVLPLAAQVSRDCNETTLPGAAREVLKAKFPSWRPKQVSDLDEDDRELWLKAHDKECPGIATGHFERADKSAYAVLLVPKANPTSGYELIVLNAPQGRGYIARVLDQAKGQTYSGLVISALAPGKYSNFEDTQSVVLKLDGIHLEWIEKGAHLFYWSGGRYHKLQISD